MSETRTEILERIQKELNLPSRADANRCFNAVFGAVTTIIARDGKREGFRYSIPGFGIVKSKHVEAKQHRDPRNGETFEKEARNKLSFRWAKEMREVGIPKAKKAAPVAKGKVKKSAKAEE